MSIISRACSGAAIVVIAATMGCGESDRPPVAESGTSPARLGTAAPGSAMRLRIGPCDTHGETETCVVEIGRHGNIVNCFRGTQICSSGTWSSCTADDEASSDDVVDDNGDRRDGNNGKPTNNPNAGGANPNAGGANPNAGGANPNAGSGNNSAGGNANANANGNAHRAGDDR